MILKPNGEPTVDKSQLEDSNSDAPSVEQNATDLRTKLQIRGYRETNIDIILRLIDEFESFEPN